MSKVRSDHLYLLIKSMRKAEKRYFKVANKGDAKYIRLFDAMDKLQSFDEEFLLVNNKWIKGEQFSNLKAHLYSKVLTSLRNYSSAAHEDISIRESIDCVQVLFDRSLYTQSMQLLQKVKRSLRTSSKENLELSLEVLKWEKNLLPYTIGKNNLGRVQQIVKEADAINEKISRVNQLTNLSVELNAIYLKTGYIRDKADYDYIHGIFSERFPDIDPAELSFGEKLIWYEIRFSYYNHLQDQHKAHEMAAKWVGLFDVTPVDSSLFESYLKGLNHLLTAQSRLGYHEDFRRTQRRLKSLLASPLIAINENLRLRLAKYTYAHQFNGYFMRGDFDMGVDMLKKIESRLERNMAYLDKHSELVLLYKITCLHFGNSNFREALKWINRILNSDHQDIREDVHSFARILNLITHYELGNTDVIEYYLRSTYRFLLKKDDLHLFQQTILAFIKNLSKISTEDELTERFKVLRRQMIELSESKYDKRAFVYFDIISWLESKIERRPVGEVIRRKAIS